MKSQAEVFPEIALRSGSLVGRIWVKGPTAGPVVVRFDQDGVHALSDLADTMSELLERPDLRQLRDLARQRDPLCSIEALLENTDRFHRGAQSAGPRLLAPCDLQVVKACGVTFAVSALERVVEERTRGNPKLAGEVRKAIQDSLGGRSASIEPGSGEAEQLKQQLLGLGMWSQYLEVAYGPDAEVFTKAAPLSAVGHGAQIGILRQSVWNNPEPEIVLAVNSRGETVGATLGNDVNLRDIEGRSALLLGKAKDNNGSCAMGPAIRLFDDTFGMDQVRAAEVMLEVSGPEGFELREYSSMQQISRDPADLVRQTVGPHHQYPDGLMLFLGTLFAPTRDRGAPGLGFTHRTGDRVSISAPELGTLVNHVDYCDAIPQWTFGIGALLAVLRSRRLP